MYWVGCNIGVLGISVWKEGCPARPLGSRLCFCERVAERVAVRPAGAMSSCHAGAAPLVVLQLYQFEHLFQGFVYAVQLAAHLIKPAICPVVKHPVDHRHHASALLSTLLSRRFRASVLASMAFTISRLARVDRISMILFAPPSALSLAPAADTRRRQTTTIRRR